MHLLVISLLAARPRGALLGCLVATALVLGASSACAATFTVVNANDAGPGSLREAITEANARPGEDTIVFRVPRSEFSPNDPPRIQLVAELAPLSDNVILLNDRQGDDSLVTVAADFDKAPFRIFTIRPGVTALIAGLRIASGRGNGGALYNDHGRVTLRNCTLFGNGSGNNSGKYSGSGGAVYNDGTPRDGGGEASLTVIRCTWEYNNADTGGAIYNTGVATLSSCTFGSNYGRLGAAVFNSGEAATLRMDNCTFRDNGSLEAGGAIYNQDARVTLTNCAFNLNVSGTTRPEEPGSGGAIYNTGVTAPAAVDLTNCTVTFNRAGAAGAFQVLGVNARLTLLNCTLWRNGRNNDGAGTGIVNESGSIETANTIFAQTAVANLGTFTSRGHNLTDEAGAVFNGPGDQRNTDPRLDFFPKDNGGETRTIALLPDSPAVDAGDDSLAPPRDQRGRGRLGRSDIGAFELNGPPPTGLANISTRAGVGTGDNVLIGGFIITGTDPKRLILRGIGPSLQLADPLDDPKLELYDAAGGLIASNDDWQDSPDKQEIIASSIAPTHDLESALVRRLTPGAYTAIVRGLNDTTGAGLVEVYDVDPNVEAKVANISTRAVVQNEVLIGGVIIVGREPLKVIVRAIGPSLPKGARLADPTLELYDANGTRIAENDNWRTEEAEVQATGIPPSHDAESALVRTLPPAPYTAVVRGKNNTTGIALVEVYTLD